MASQMDSAGATLSIDRYWHPVIPGLSFVVLVAALNVALNGFLSDMAAHVQPSVQYEYAVAVSLAPLVAGGLVLATGVLAVCSLALFVRSVGTGGDSDLRPVPVQETLRRFGRATGVVAVGLLALPLGLGLLVVPGLVVIVYLPFVFLGVVLDGRTIGGAITESHARIADRPGAVVATSLATALGLLVVGLGGILSTSLAPGAEFVVGAAASAFVVLLGISLLTRFYQRPRSKQSSRHGQL
jgi:hypothetical protein